MVSPPAPADGYGSYAAFYDALHGDRSVRIARIQGLLNHYAPECSSVLELACGTGSILAGLDGRYEKTGLDNSRAMLAFAHKKLPAVTFVHGDMAALQLGRTFDAIFCTFNSVDHLPDFAAWQNLFYGVAEHLNPSGIFIFDTNSYARLAELAKKHNWSVPMAHGHGRVVSTVRTISGSDAISWHMAYTVDGQLKQSETVRLCTYAPERIVAALQRCFTVLDMQGLPGDPLAYEDAGRLYFICRKPTL